MPWMQEKKERERKRKRERERRTGLELKIRVQPWTHTAEMALRHLSRFIK